MSFIDAHDFPARSRATGPGHRVFDLLPLTRTPGRVNMARGAVPSWGRFVLE